MMPLCGLATCVFVALHWRKAEFIQAISNNGSLDNQALLNKLYFVVTKVSPVLIAVILIYGLLP
jgi:SNF family Na+-dependent transporter